MGQDITVTQSLSGSDSAHIFTLNRSLTGMETSNYSDPEMVVDPNNAADVLAHKLLDLGVESVSIYSNMVTVHCEPEVYTKIDTKVLHAIEGLFRFYPDA